LPAHGKATFFARISPRLVETPVTRSPSTQEAGDLAVFDDVHAAAVGTAGIAPGDRIVPGGAGAFAASARP
jgi:hypothetical protein